MPQVDGEPAWRRPTHSTDDADRTRQAGREIRDVRCTQGGRGDILVRGVPKERGGGLGDRLRRTAGLSADLRRARRLVVGSMAARARARPRARHRARPRLNWSCVRKHRNQRQERERKPSGPERPVILRGQDCPANATPSAHCRKICARSRGPRIDRARAAANPRISRTRPLRGPRAGCTWRACPCRCPFHAA